MNKVITINLGGNAYQLEEGGFDALRSYLDAARRRLDGNPDRDEIIADIERAIADKFRSLLSAAKNVVVTVEVTAIIAEMGPVEDGSGSTSSSAGAQAASHAEPGASAADSGGTPPKRLYKIHEGAMAGGVCTGLAAYLNLDVTIVRLLFAILIFVYGAGILLYVLMAILLPSATTSAEKAAAHGTPSATAQEFIRRAREGYYQGMKTMGDRQAHRAWRRRFKSDMREWRRTMKRQMHFSPYTWWHSADPAAGPPPPPPHVWFTDPLVGFLMSLVTLAGLCAIYLLLTTGAAFGVRPPADIPMWAVVVFVLLVIKFVRWPLKAMRRPYSCWHGADAHGPARFMVQLLMWVAIASSVYWLFQIGHGASFHDAAHQLSQKLQHATTSFRQWWERL